MTASTPVLILKTRRYAVHHGGVGIIRSLGRLGIPVYAVTEDWLTPAATSRYLARGFVWNAENLPRSQMLEALSAIGTRIGKPTILIPTDDLGAVLIAEEAATLRRWFVFPEISPGLPRKLANKATLFELCRQMNVPSPDTLFPTSLSDVSAFAETACFPVVIKAAAAWLETSVKTSIVGSAPELIDLWHRSGSAQNPNLIIQEYIPCGEDWFFHGYCNGASDCLAGFTGMKLRSFPPHSGLTTLGRSATNDALLHQTETLLKAISYAGIVDIDYRFDPRDRQYKLLDFNPRVGAQFRVFVDDNGLDVARVIYRDLSGEVVRRAKQVDGRVIVVEPDDLRASLGYFRRGELSIGGWLRSFRGPKELAWFSWDDPLPFLMAWARLAARGVARMIRLASLKSGSAVRQRGGGQESKAERAMPVAQLGAWSRPNPSALWQYLAGPWRRPKD